MKWVLVIFIATFTLVGTASGQAATPCPSGLVCLTPEQARAGLVAMDTVKAQEQQILDLKKAVLDEKSLNVDIKIELAKTVGQMTGVQGENVTLRALVDLLVKSTRKKSVGFVAF